ncbi:MAG: OmpA family protein [Geminicoccaceae bacterium]|jgi:outer membrane protein OmpA-like peptidoglycan-associated protein
MSKWLLSAAVVALVSPAVQAQTTAPASQPMTDAGEVARGRYLVFFDFNKSTLTPAARQVISEAAADFRNSGQSQLQVVGHTDTSGSAAYNQRLSERRAASVQAELVRLGVPESAVVVTGSGQNDLLVPTADQVREPQNRRVEIIVPQRPAPAPMPVAEQAPPAPPPEPPREEPKRFTFKLGALYGHNFGESDKAGSGSKTQNDLVGPELTFDALPGDIVGLSLKQSVLYSFNGVDDGVNGRTILSLGLTPLNLIVFRPYLSANFGGVYGPGFQDGLVAGPELGFNVGLTDTVNLGLKVAYDYQFRNTDWDDGILWGGLDLGYRF